MKGWKKESLLLYFVSWLFVTRARAFQQNVHPLLSSRPKSARAPECAPPPAPPVCAVYARVLLISPFFGLLFFFFLVFVHRRASQERFFFVNKCPVCVSAVHTNAWVV